MIQENDILQALHELYKQVGTQKKLAELAGITQSTINAYLSGKAKIENMPVGVFIKLFRDMNIDYFGEQSADKTIDILKDELISIFDKLDTPEKVSLLSMAATHFGKHQAKGK